MGNESDTRRNKSVAKKILADAASWLKDVATDAVAEVIKSEITKREKKKAVAVEEVVIIPPTVKRKHRRAIKYNANKNN
jgi:hypothetical protein